MSKDGMNQHECRKYIPAFADGELDVEQNLKVLEQMAMDPTNTRRVLHQQQLRKACSHAMDTAECRCPDELRSKIAALAEAEPAHDASDPALSEDAGVPSASHQTYTGPPVIARIGRWAPVAVAAMLLIGTLVVLYQAPGGISDAWPYINRVVMGNTDPDLLSGRHELCSSDVSKLYAGIESPEHVSALPGTVDDYFGDDLGRIDSTLDLSVLGYEFERVGVCAAPGKGAVHVVYRAPEGSGRTDAISLWIKPDTGEFSDLTPNVLHTAAESNTGRPLLFWRHDGRVYYLIGDSPTDTRRAAHMLALDE